MRTVSFAPMWNDTDEQRASVSEGYSVVGKSDSVARVAAPNRIITITLGNGGTYMGGCGMTRMPLDDDFY